MDYFSQLLDSYDKLKKRKFRIVYEQGGGVEILAQNLVNQAKAGQSQVPIPGKSGWVNVTKSGPNQGNVTFFHPGYGRQITIVDSSGPTANYEEYLRYLSSTEDGNAQGAAKEEEPLEAGPILPTNELEQFMPPEWTEKTKEDFVKITDELTDLCSKINDPLLCTHIEDYTVKHPQRSLASKLLNSVTILRDADTGREIGTIEDTIDPGLVEDVVGSVLEFIKLIAKPDALICDQLNSRISFNSDRMTILSKSGEEGLVLPASDRLLSTLKKIIPEKACKKASFKNAFFNKRPNKSNLLGSFNEHLVGFAMSISLAANNPHAQEIAKRRIVEVITKTRTELDAVLQEYKNTKNSTYSIEAYSELLDNLELAGVLNTESLKKHVGSRMLMIKEMFSDFFEDKNMDGYFLPIGAYTKTGARADGLFVIRDEKQAKKLAKFLTGMSPDQSTPRDLCADYGSDFTAIATEYGLDTASTEPVYVISLGIKAYDDAPKLGEINRYTRMQNLLTGRVAPDDKYLKKGFLNKIDRLLDADPESLGVYADTLMNKADQKVKFVLDGAAFRDQKGALRSMKQKEILDYVRTKISNDLGYRKRLESALAGILGKTEDSLDLTVPENSERLSELIKRNTILHTLSKDLASPDKETSTLAKQTLLKMLFIGGGNFKPLGQLTVSDKGVNVFQHGRVMDDIIKDINSGKGRIEFDGIKSSIKFSTAKGEEVILGFEGTWTGKVREGRMVVKYKTKESFQTNESTTRATLEQYLKGQKLLLDELFRSIKAY